MNTILLLEDEESLNRGISLKLQKEGYEVVSAAVIHKGFQLFEQNAIDLVICDIMLEDGSGMDFLTEIRKKSNVHFIFLTAMDQEMDIVLGYETGADDYITKPFSLAVLISKVNAIFKRAGSAKGDLIKSGDIMIVKNEAKVSIAGEERMLTMTEWKLLVLFLEHPKQILSKNNILESLFDADGEFVDENTVAVNIRRLREKIEEDPSKPEYIKNVRGLGYLWNRECQKC